MGMFDDVAAEHERTKHVPKPTSEEIARAKWDELGLAELAEEYAHFARQERLPMQRIRNSDGYGITAAWVVSGTHGEYDFNFAVLPDGGVVPVCYSSSRGVEFQRWTNPFYLAKTVRRAFLDTAARELEQRDGIA